MARADQRYVTELLVEILGPCEVEKRYDWARGDPGVRAGATLPFDCVWEQRRLIVEIDERQHGEAVSFFDKPDKLTVSGVHRGLQRKLYDDRKMRLAQERGYTVLRIPTADLTHQGRRLVGDRESDRRVLIRLLEGAEIITDR